MDAVGLPNIDELGSSSRKPRAPSGLAGIGAQAAATIRGGGIRRGERTPPEVSQNLTSSPWCTMVPDGPFGIEIFGRVYRSRLHNSCRT
jgi:hypothetical protein